MTTTVHLLRHGEVHNPDQILYGRLDGYRLSESGESMARVVAEHLAARDVVYLASSPLERAQQTAAPLAEKLGLDVVTDLRLTEAGNVFEGMSIAAGARAFTKLRNVRHLRNPTRPSWGEAYQAIAERMLAAIGSARHSAEGHEAVLVSHQLPIYIARRYLEGRRLWHRPDRRLCALASVTALHYDGDRLLGITYTEPA